MTGPGPAARRRLHLGCLGLVLAIVLITALVARWQGNSEIRRPELAIKHVEQLGGQADRFSVDLSHTKAGGDDLQIVQQFDGLKRLDLGHTNLASGDGIYLQAFSRLEFLSLAGNNLSDGDLAALGDLSGLRVLSLRDVPITDAGLVHLAGLTALKSLDLAGTDIHASGLSALRSLPVLKVLTLSEDCVTADALTALRSLDLQYVFVDVQEGNGKPARDLLATLDDVLVEGIMRNGSATLWFASAPWDTTTAGVAELVASDAGLEDREAAQLLRVLARLRFDGGWPRPITYPAPNLLGPAAADRTPASITTIEEFIERLQTSGNWSDEQLRRYAHDNVTEADVPKLLKTVQNKQWHHQHYGVLRLVSALLVRHGLHHKETEQVLRELLSEEPGSLSPPSPLAHWHPMQIPKTVAYALDPSYDPFQVDGSGWAMTTNEAQVVFRLLASHARHNDPTTDHVEIEFRGVVISALGGIANPDLAPDIMALLVHRIADPNIARYDVVRAIGQVARVAPAAAVSALPELNKLLDHRDPAVRATAVEAIGYAAAGDDRAARTAADMCLLLLSDSDEISKSAGAGIALGNLVAGNTPQTRRHIVQQLLRMSGGHWASRSTQRASAALTIVVTTIRDGTAAYKD